MPSRRKEAAYARTHGSLGCDSIEKPEFLAVDLQFFFYSFDVAPNLSNCIGYFFFCFPETLAPMTHQSWRG
jgi:hypothetical protein